MNNNEIELAWAAGFFDGEGHVRSKKDANGRRAEMQVAQKTRECLERLQKAIGGVGTIGGPYHSRNPVYFWYLTKTPEVDRVLTILWPYLSGPKRTQAEKAGFVLGFVRTPKTGRPSKKLEERMIPTCHPTRKYVGNGLCGSCYQMAWRNKKNGK
jgi:hypothetical protein